MPEPDLYRPLIGMSVRLTERLTSRLPNVLRERCRWPGCVLPNRPVTPVRRKFPQGYHLRDDCARSRRPCAGLPADGQMTAPVTERSRVGGVHRRADHRTKTWIRAADTVSLPAGKVGIVGSESGDFIVILRDGQQPSRKCPDPCLTPRTGTAGSAIPGQLRVFPLGSLLCRWLGWGSLKPPSLWEWGPVRSRDASPAGPIRSGRPSSSAALPRKVNTDPTSPPGATLRP